MERIETISGCNYRIIQDPERFCFGIDAYLLAAYASFRKDSRIVDLGTGTGIIPLLLAARSEKKTREILEKKKTRTMTASSGNAGDDHVSGTTQGCEDSGIEAVRPLPLHIKGVEVQQASADMAQRSVALNGLQKNIEILNCDLRQVFSFIPKNSADVVTANPPYMPVNHGKKCPSDAMAIARHEILCSLEDVVQAATGLLNSDGRFFMIHRPERLAEIMESLVRNRLEPKRLRFVLPCEGAAPTMVLIDACKGARHGLVIEKPLAVYAAGKEYSDEMKEIYANWRF